MLVNYIKTYPKRRRYNFSEKIYAAILFTSFKKRTYNQSTIFGNNAKL